MRTDPRAVIAFWRDGIGEAGWYAGTPEIDAAIARRWSRAARAARAGAFAGWVARPDGALALLLLLDQFPRNIWRGTPQAFASDARARRVARRALALGHDRKIAEPLRQFFYLPFAHSERLAEQDLSVLLYAARMPRARRDLVHAHAHREVIRRYGRFPFRNAALGRTTTPAEAEFLAAGGYPALVRALGGR